MGPKRCRLRDDQLLAASSSLAFPPLLEMASFEATIVGRF
jgi:hypothetical protein